MRLIELFMINEDSRGNIVRLLGMTRGWADFFHTSCGKLAFPVANWLLTMSQASAEPIIFSRSDQSEQPETEITRMLVSLPYYKSFGNAGGIRGPSNLHDPIRSAVSDLKADRPLLQALSSPKPDVATLERLENEAKERREGNVDVSQLGSEFLALPNGFVWKTVDDDDMCGFAGPMKSCGESGGDDQMFVLFDPSGRPHVFASYEKSTNSFDQVAGKGNSIPAAKFQPMIDALLGKMGARLRRGRKSLGASFA